MLGLELTIESYQVQLAHIVRCVGSVVLQGLHEKASVLTNNKLTLKVYVAVAISLTKMCSSRQAAETETCIIRLRGCMAASMATRAVSRAGEEALASSRISHILVTTPLLARYLFVCRGRLPSSSSRCYYRATAVA